MRITEIELHGFKSFAQKIKLKFDSGHITGIIGPNGSGKSNIVDALRWVLGEQRAGILRSEKMENVIFNGGAKKKPLGMAEVSLKIENDKNVLPSDYHEIEITRRLFRSGESQYLINGTKCRLKDINDLFMDTGIGPDAYSVIELKMIESILSQNKEERRQLFEEAAGISKYKRSRKAAMRKLDSTREDLVRLNDIIVEVEKNVRNLSRQVAKVRRYKELQNQLRHLELSKSHWQFYHLIEGIRPIKEELEHLQNSNTATSAQLSLDEELLYKYQADVIKFEDSLKTKRESLRKIEEQINGLEKLQIVEDERRQSNERNKSAYSEEMNDIQKKVDELSSEKEKAQNQIEEFEQEITSYQNLYDDSYTEIQKIEQEINKVQENINSRSGELKKIQQDINELSEQKSKFDFQLENLNDQLSALSESVLNISTEEKGKNDLLVAKREHNDQLIVQQHDLSKNKNKAVANRNKIQTDIEKVKDKLLEIRSKLKNNENQHRFFKDLATNFTGFSDAVKKVMQAKDKFPGLLGPLPGLLIVPEEWEIAVEAALGEWTNILVVEDSKTEHEITEFVGESRKVFVLNLERLEHYSKFSFPRLAVPKKVKGYLVDVVEIDKRILPFMERLMANVMLCDEFSDAEQMWKKFSDHTFFTKNGGVVYTEGVVQSGKRESAYLTGREHLMEKYEAEIRKGTKLLVSEENKLQQFIDSQERAINEINTIEGKISELDKDILENRSTIVEIETQLQETTNRQDRINVRIKDLENEIEETQNEIKKRNPTIEKLFFQEEEMVTEINSFESDLEKFQEQYNSLSEKSNETRFSLVKAQSNLDQFINKVKNSDALKVEYLGTLHRRDADISQLAKEINQFGENKIEREEVLITLWQERDKNAGEIRSDEETLINIKEKTRKTDDQLRQYRQAHEIYLEKRQSLEMKVHDAEIRAASIADQVRERYEMEISENAPKGEMELEQVELEIEQANKKLNFVGEVNALALEEYDEENERLQFLMKHRADLLNSEAKLLDAIREINETATKQFNTIFEQININFSRVFKEFFEEGDGALLLEEDVDPLEANIEISVRPKGRKPQTIALMSSGEKSLTAISLLFSIYLVKPSPFCILDEVDAPLDDVNIGRFSRAIKRFSDDTQFIIVTHNKRTMEVLDSIYGITQEEAGVSKIVSVDFKQMELN